MNDTVDVELKPKSRSLIGATYALLLVVLIAVAYSQATRNGFVTGFDDGLYVTGNPHVQAGLTPSGIRWALTTTHAANWHPLTWISHMLDWQMFGSNPAGHHLTNIILHAANTLLLFALLCSMTGHRRRSFFVAALFAVHPLHVESVAWVAERKDVLSTFFGLLSVAAYLRYVSRPRARRYALIMLAFALSLLSKPMLVSLPFLLILLDYWPLRRTTRLRALILEKLPLLALALASCLVTIWAQHRGGAMTPIANVPLSVRPANAAVSCVTYVVKMLWPSNLAAFYPHPLAALPIWQVIISAVLTAAAFALAILLRKTRPYVTVGWLWYAITLLPVIGLVQVGAQAMADRYTYVPSIGLFIAIAWLAAEALQRRQRIWRAAALILACATITAFTVRTYAEVGYWRDNESLFTRAIDVTQNNLLAHYDLALDLQQRGYLSDAAEHYREVLRIDPTYMSALRGLGFVSQQEGDYGEALRAYGAMLKLRPRSTEATRGIAMALAGQGKLTDSAAFYAAVVKMTPRSAQAHYNLGNAMFRLNRLDAAAGEYRKAIRLSPGYVEAHHNLGVYFEHKGQVAGAVKEYSEVVRLTPGDPAAHDTLATVLYTSGDYAAAWEQVHQTAQCGGQPNPDLVALLQRKMPEPRR